MKLRPGRKFVSGSRGSTATDFERDISVARNLYQSSRFSDTWQTAHSLFFLFSEIVHSLRSRLQKNPNQAQTAPAMRSLWSQRPAPEHHARDERRRRWNTLTKKAIATRRKTKKARTGLVLIAILMNEQGKTEVQWFFTEAIVCLSESSFVLALNTSVPFNVLL